MANYPSKASMPIAIEKFSELDLSCTHTTTSNFMEFNVANIIECVPKATYDVSHNAFNRLVAMPAPTYGLAQQKLKAFFVPMRTIMPGFLDFYEDSSHTFSDGRTDVITTVPTLGNDVFVKMFMLEDFSYEVSSDVAFDFSFIPPALVGNPIVTVFRRLTPLGKYAWKLFTSLGYKFSFNGCDTGFTKQKSLMPLFSIVKVYLDWYFPQNYAQSDVVYRLERFLKYNGYDPIANIFDEYSLASIISTIHYVCYDSDYIVSAWDNPTAPTDGAYSPISVPDITTPNDNSDGVSLDTNGTPVVSTRSVLSQFALTSLKKVTDYLTRHRIAGARVIDRYLARFGIVLDAAKLDRSLYLDDASQYINFHDVTSTADTEGANLGSYAGKGTGDTKLSFTFTADEPGYLIMTCSVVPRTSNVEGCHRMTDHITKYDFWTPEFDNLGVQLMGVSEVFMPSDSRQMYPNFTPTLNFDPQTGIRGFGFVPRFAEYKTHRDIVSGDFSLESMRAESDPWTLYRKMASLFEANGMHTPHSVDFVLGNDAQQYSRIFYDTSTNRDKFKIVHVFDIQCRFPGRKLYDSYEFDSENSPRVTVDAGGVKTN